MLTNWSNVFLALTDQDGVYDSCPRIWSSERNWLTTIVIKILIIITLQSCSLALTAFFGPPHFTLCPTTCHYSALMTLRCQCCTHLEMTQKWTVGTNLKSSPEFYISLYHRQWQKHSFICVMFDAKALYDILSHSSFEMEYLYPNSIEKFNGQFSLKLPWEWSLNIIPQKQQSHWGLSLFSFFGFLVHLVTMKITGLFRLVVAL